MSGKYRFTKVYKQTLQDNPPDLELIPGKLGLTIGGSRQVEIPSRPGYVWVRLRGDLSESIQAYNAAVSPVYGLPVLVRRDRANKSRYSIVGKDDGAYQSWGNNASSYLPRHGATHSFDPNAPGGDVTWIWGNQFMPLAVTPSGTSGAMSVLIQAGAFYQNTSWHYLGAIGTASLESYKPTGSFSRMVLVYLDEDSDPAYELGAFFDASITGTSQVMQYIPDPPASPAIPLAGIRLVSGSSYLSWDNIYDVRGFFAGSLAGSVLPDFGAYQVVYGSSTSGLTGSSNFSYDGNENSLVVGGSRFTGTTSLYGGYGLTVVADSSVSGDGNDNGVMLDNYGWGEFTTRFQNGTQLAPQIVSKGDYLFYLNVLGRAYDGSTSLTSYPTTAEIYVEALQMFSGSTGIVKPTKMVFSVANSGTDAGLNETLLLYGDRAVVDGKIVASTATLGDLVGANYTEILSDGTLRLHGTATAWDDLRVAADATKLGGSKDPGYSVFKTNGAGSRGVFTYWFDNATEEEVYFSVQMPHAWKQGSTIYPHVHWTPSSTGTAGQQVVWGLEYTWANLNEFFPNTTIINTSGTSIHDNTLNGGEHYLSSYPPISAVGKTLSSMILCRLFRNVGDPDDDYVADAGLLEFDVHYEIDSFGSENEFNKV